MSTSEGRTPARLASEEVVISAPMSFTGATQRIWKLTRISAGEQPAVRVALVLAAILLLVIAWTIVLSWYVTFGLLLVPYRLLRRGSRKRRRQSLQHRELLATMQGGGPNPALAIPPAPAIAAVEAGERASELPAGDA
jgi:uncharacterized membrane-anchored protein